MNKGKENILVLNVHEKDPELMNDFADFNAEQLIKCFGSGSVFYFSDSVTEHGIKKTETMIKKAILEGGVSVVFFAPNGDNYELSVGFFRELSEAFGVKTVLLVLDDDLIFDVHTKYYSQVFDAVITADYYATFAYRKLGVPALYYFSSYRKADFYPVQVAKDIDVSFVGDCTKCDRMEYVEYLRRHGVRVMLFGDGSPGGFVRKQDMPVIFSRSRINLNFTRLDRASSKAWFLEENSLTNLMRQNKGRPMEISLTRSFCLTEYSPSLEASFEIEKEIDVFRDREELLSKVCYYLANDDIREQMAENAYRKAVNFYEADVFMPRLVEDLRKILEGASYPQRSREIYTDTAFKMNHTIRLFIISFYQLSRLRVRNALEAARRAMQYGGLITLGAFFKAARISLARKVSKVKTWRARRARACEST
ncbi:MAG: glycosyltransferase [Thermodesulfobacteriota bacterium]